MMIQLYKDGIPVSQIDLPADVFQAAVTLEGWLAANGPGMSLYGLGRVADFHRQLKLSGEQTDRALAQTQRAFAMLADAIRERDQYKAACELADALRPLGAIQVVEGGGAVLLDTGRK